MSGATYMSGRRALFNAPLARETLVRLSKIIQPVVEGEEEKEFDERQQLGFDAKSWYEAHNKMFPVRSMQGGSKHEFGHQIQLNMNRPRKQIVFAITTRARDSHIEALLEFLAKNYIFLPSLKIFLKNKQYDRLRGVTSEGDLRSAIYTLLARRKRLTFKLAW